MGKKPHKSLTKTQFFDAVLQYLIDNYDWDQTQFNRKDAKAIVEAVVAVAVSRSTDKRGCTIPGLARIYHFYKKATKKRKMRNPFTHKKMIVQAKPARYIPKIRAVKAFKDAMAEVAPESNEE